jgi:hypothetical protein
MRKYTKTGFISLIALWTFALLVLLSGIGEARSYREVVVDPGQIEVVNAAGRGAGGLSFIIRIGAANTADRDKDLYATWGKRRTSADHAHNAWMPRQMEWQGNTPLTVKNHGTFPIRVLLDHK